MEWRRRKGERNCSSDGVEKEEGRDYNEVSSDGVEEGGREEGREGGREGGRERKGLL